MRISDWSSDVCSSDLGASSLAAGHKTLIPQLINLLRDNGRPDIKVVAGGVIPSQDYQFLRDDGVAGIYGPGSNVIESAADVLRLMGHNMPHAGQEEAADGPNFVLIEPAEQSMLYSTKSFRPCCVKPVSYTAQNTRHMNC